MEELGNHSPAAPEAGAFSSSFLSHGFGGLFGLCGNDSPPTGLQLYALFLFDQLKIGMFAALL